MLKKIIDSCFALFGVVVLFPILLICWLLAAIDTHSNGLFLQARIGQFGKPFTIYKLRTMHFKKGSISKFGAFLRNYKLDELPQLLNVLQGNMSVVGPRPDIPGYYDKLEGKNRLILNLKPGLTSLAAIKYADEDTLLAAVENPQQYNDEVIFPDKVKLNLDYYYNHSFWGDIKIIKKTIWIFLSNDSRL